MVELGTIFWSPWLLGRWIILRLQEKRGGVYIAALVLALGVHLPLPDFVREVLVYYHLAPAQLAPGSWRVVLGFAALGRSQDVSLGIGEFRVIYFLKPLTKGSYCFSPGKDKKKLIDKVPESDKGWKNLIALVTGRWESLVPEEWGRVPRAWGEPGTFSAHRRSFYQMLE